MNLLKKRITKILQDTDNLTVSAILRRINKEYPIRKERLSAVKKALNSLAADGAITEREGLFALKKPSGTMAGVFLGTSRGYGFVRPEEGGSDYFIPPGKTGGAWHGDHVLVKPRLSSRSDKNKEAHIEEIIKPANKFVTGRVVRTKRGSYLEPDSAKLPERIDINTPKNVRTGDKAALRIMSRGETPSGTVHKVFGKDGTLEAAVASVLFNNNIEMYFPDPVKAEAAEMSLETDSSVAARVDLRDELIFTIDGETAKDLDDAVSISKTPDSYILGVHIADVSHYVRKGSALDNEAYERGTSVYFADRVIPMLPAELSNGICSLNPGADRLTMSVIMRVNKNGDLADYKIHESVIHSKARMTYDGCNAILAGEPHTAHEQIKDALINMSELADILTKRRIARGALEFETTQSVILCGADGRPTDIFPALRGVSERIIEEFMIAANEAVAEHIFNLKKPAVYRVHEKPESDKIASFAAVAANFGYIIGRAEEVTPKALQAVTDAMRGKPEERALGLLLLRSLMKARYCAENLGHFGLASRFYCHFTSPIRRYPDLVVHRFLKLMLCNKLTGDVEKQAAAFAMKAAEQASEREIKAMTAEREIEKIYKADYMSAHIGEQFDGIISGVQPFGLFVELPNSVEGFLAVENLGGGDYYYDENSFCLTCVHDKTQYKLGQPVTVVCTGASVSAGHIEFRLPEDG